MASKNKALGGGPKGFGSRLREHLKESGETQIEFAKRIGVSQPTVCDWLSGKITPSVENLITISSKTGLSLDYLAKGAS